MPSEKQIAYVADAIDFALGDIKKTRLFSDRIDLIKDIVRRSLTAAEQAEPAPAARSGVVKVDDSLLNALRLSGRVSFDEFKQTVLRAIETAEPAADVEPVAWIMNGKGENWEERNVVTFDKETADMKAATEWWTVEPVYTRLPESRLREALEGLLAPFSDDPCRLDHHGYCQAHFLELHCCVAKARAALAQEDGR